MLERVSRVRLTLALTALLLLTVVAPAAAQRPTGAQDLDAAAAFTLRGLEGANSVSNVGDVDGDGREDAAVGAGDEYGEDGEVRVILAGDAPGVRGFRIVGAETDENFEAPVSAGDLNGDGLGDIAVSLGSNAAVVFGRRTPRDVDLDRPEQRDLLIRDAGYLPLASLGDVNGDGVDDLLAGGEGGDDERFDGERRSPVRSRAAIVFGAPGIGGEIDPRKLGDRGQLLLAPRGEQAVFGAGAGDVDGDGLGDLVLGSPLNGSVDEDGAWKALRGVAYVVYGRRSPGVIDLANSAAGATRMSIKGIGYLGLSVAGPGDMNGDGLADVAVGAPLLSGLAPGAGGAFVVFGDRGRPATVDLDALGAAGITLRGTQRRGSAGFGLTPAGDIDGDGRRDLLVGEPAFADLAEIDDPGAGAAHVVFGGEAGTVDLGGGGDRTLALRGARSDAVGVSQAGDVDLDGDGRRELLLARPGACLVGRLDEGDVLAVELLGPAPTPAAGVGGAGGDRLAGGPVGDSLSGLGGADDLRGRDGHDCVEGGEDADRVRGGLSGDVLFGGLGADALFGDSGCDRIFGGEGDDVIVAGPEQVPLAAALRAPIGARDRDTVDAGAGDDQVTGGSDRDDLDGADGDDRLSSGSASDEIEGGAGRDRIDGGSGSDGLDAGPGDDVIRGGSGGDYIVGDGFEGEEDFGLLLDPRARTPEPGDDRIDGGTGDDLLEGGDGDDAVSGASGRDRITGDEGRDRLSGGTGNDRINSRDEDRDVVDCGPGRDIAFVDRRDRVRGCERVRRGRR